MAGLRHGATVAGMAEPEAGSTRREVVAPGPARQGLADGADGRLRTRAAGDGKTGLGEPVISVCGLRKSYGEHEVVRGIDIEVRHGEIFAFLGPNGAGKTTTVEILEGYRSRNAGEVSVLDEDPAAGGSAWRSRIGLVLQSCTMPAELTVRELVELYAGYYSHPRPSTETIELVGLAEKSDARTKQLSGGQLRRLDVALALIGDPELVFLDEPTTGFDPSARHHAWEVIANLRDLGKTIFLTTHYMDEAQALADRVAVISAGEIVAEGTPQTLGGRDHAMSDISFALPPHTALSELPGELASGASRRDDGRVHISVPAPARSLYALAGWALERGEDLGDLTVGRPTLEDVYLQLTDGGEHSS
jgi:ABC-2 type transport system ATP-binding protein